MGDWRVEIANCRLMKPNPQVLEDRLIDFGTAVGLALRRMPRDIAGIHISKQMIRSATSPAANYAEARSAESRRDFAHKMQICLKELRETSVWLRMADRIGLEGAGVLIGECNELLSNFVSSIKTVKASLRRL